MKLLSSFTLLFVMTCSLAAHANSVQWLDASGQFRLIMLEQTNAAYPALFYGSNQRSGPHCPTPGSCAFVLRGRIVSAQTLIFEPLKLSAAGSNAAGLEGHQSELPAQRIDDSETVWSFYSTDPTHAKLTCISPETSCAYFEAELLLEKKESAIAPAR